MTVLTAARPEQIVHWAIETYGQRVSLACSVGAEDMVLVDMLCRITDATLRSSASLRSTSSPRIFFLDTGRLHQETYDLMAVAMQRYGISFETYFPQTDALEALVSAKGPNSFYDSVENRRECCRIRKVEPLTRALTGLNAWITGLRRGQSVTRTDLQAVEIDEAHGGMLKINPLADWSEDDVWDYIRKNAVPYNALHDKGFPSIGCAPCTRAVAFGEDLRAGRWWWESPEHKECGLHRRAG